MDVKEIRSVALLCHYSRTCSQKLWFKVGIQSITMRNFRKTCQPKNRSDCISNSFEVGTLQALQMFHATCTDQAKLDERIIKLTNERHPGLQASPTSTKVWMTFLELTKFQIGNTKYSLNFKDRNSGELSPP